MSAALKRRRSDGSEPVPRAPTDLDVRHTQISLVFVIRLRCFAENHRRISKEGDFASIERKASQNPRSRARSRNLQRCFHHPLMFSSWIWVFEHRTTNQQRGACYSPDQHMGQGTIVAPSIHGRSRTYVFTVLKLFDDMQLVMARTGRLFDPDTPALSTCGIARCRC